MMLDNESQRGLLMRFIEEANYDYDTARDLVKLEDAIKHATILGSGQVLSHEDDIYLHTPHGVTRRYNDAEKAEAVLRQMDDADVAETPDSFIYGKGK